MTLKEALAQLEALGDEKVRAYNIRNGAGKNQFGVKLGDIRKLATKIKIDHELALALWKTGNLDARLLAIPILVPKKLSAEEVDRMVRSANVAQIGEWLLNSLPGTPEARHRDRRTPGDLPRLPGLQRVHVAVRADLDPGDGAASELTELWRWASVTSLS